MPKTSNQNVVPVAFTIAGIGLDTEEISRVLNLEPSHTHRVGEPNTIGKPFPHDMWQLDTPLGEVEPLDAHLKWLIEKLRPHYDFLRSLKSNAELSVYCGLNCDSDQCGFTLTPDALAIFTELGMSMEVTILFGSEDY